MTDNAVRSPHQVLARKWRPRRFSELVGQEHVVRALSNALDSGRLHHAYLFTGTRGVGKTTLARILAKALNCQTGLGSNPCGECTACREIDAGRFVDLVEVDAATNTRVEEMRELLDTAQYLPVAGRFKVYIIDEVHMLSRSAFNSMLKTLEEPPAHVKFILATTDPQKVPVTVLSRCLQFNLKQMAPQQLADHLAEVLRREQVPYDVAALQMVARAARGSMRDGLSLLDQAIAFGGGRVESEAIGAMLGTIAQDHLFDLLEALAAGDGQRLMALADAMVERSLSLDSALQDLASLLHRLAVLQTVPAAHDPTEPGADRIQALAAALAPDDIQLYYQIAVIGRRDLGLAPNEPTGFAMTLLRMLAFRLDDGGPQAARPGSAAEAAAAARAAAAPPAGRAAALSTAPAAAASRPAASPPPGVAAPAAAARASTAATVDAPPFGAASAATPAASTMARRQPAAAAAVVPPAPLAAAGDPPVAAEPAVTGSAEAGAGPDAAAPVDEPGWLALVRGLDGIGVAAELAKNCEFVRQEGGVLELRLPERQKQLLPFRDKLRSALQARCSQPIRINIELAAEEGGRSLAALDDVVRRDRLAQAIESIEADPFVREMKEQFGARVVESSIRPEER